MTFAQAIKRTSSKRTHICLALLFLAVLVAIWWQVSGSRALAHRWVVGERLMYRIEYTSGSVTNLTVLTNEQGAKDEQVIFTNVEGSLQATVLEVNADGVLLACSLRELEVQVVYNDELALAQAE